MCFVHIEEDNKMIRENWLKSRFLEDRVGVGIIKKVYFSREEL